MKKSLPRKIIYFDETSAVDLLQVRQKGHLTRTEETIRSMSGKIGADADINAKTRRRWRNQQTSKTYLRLVCWYQLNDGSKRISQRK
ncbi:hypothetical protein Lpp124_10278 [Lacticaseibacillus paracasei subsp. paracasei CNCM I-4649]|nr:hypothetical protein Lpp124_10278 [Lacticaseibacillus paracasei subsp. paracasei CNCM I-4649]